MVRGTIAIPPVYVTGTASASALATPGRSRPAVLRRTRPGSQHRLSPRIWDGERQMPTCGRLVSGIMPATEDHIVLRARHHA